MIVQKFVAKPKSHYWNLRNLIFFALHIPSANVIKINFKMLGDKKI
jgi:hypothetical protein